jgi:hypothetical protein
MVTVLAASPAHSGHQTINTLVMATRCCLTYLVAVIFLTRVKESKYGAVKLMALVSVEQIKMS